MNKHNRARRRHEALNPKPNITMLGSELDRLCNGVVTREILKQVEKSKLLTEPNFDVPGPTDIVIPTPFTPRIVYPLLVVLLRASCACGDVTKSFSHFTRRVVEKIEGGEITRYATVANPDGERPSGFIWNEQIVPFCPSCITRQGISKYE